MTRVEIDFVSDVACPWCAVGLASLERALEAVSGEMDVTLRFHPFELNPDMGPEGRDVGEYLSEKYGSTAEDQAAIRERIGRRGAEVGFTFRPEGRGRVWNTFDAHRLLHWAGEVDPARQLALKRALLQAYHGRAESPADPAVLLAAVAQAGLDGERAQAILAADDYAQAVRDEERDYQVAGVRSVPAVIINRQYLISGGQPPAVFEQALRRVVDTA